MVAAEEWCGYAARFKDVLGLEGSPIAVTYTFTPPAPPAKSYRVCDALLRARHGETVVLTAQTQRCGGGNFQLGLTQRPLGLESKPLKDFLVDGEKLYGSYAAFYRSQALSPPPPYGLADHVVLAPMGEAELKPDVVVFVVNATQACRLVTLDMFETGVPAKMHAAGATCYQVITYPLVTSETNVSLMDFTSRKIKGYSPHDLFVSIPYPRLHAAARAIPLCTAGTAKFEYTEGFRGDSREGGGGE